MVGAYGFRYCFALSSLFCVPFSPGKLVFFCRFCVFGGGFSAISCGQIFVAALGNFCVQNRTLLGLNPRGVKLSPSQPCVFRVLLCYGSFLRGFWGMSSAICGDDVLDRCVLALCVRAFA